MQEKQTGNDRAQPVQDPQAAQARTTAAAVAATIAASQPDSSQGTSATELDSPPNSQGWREEEPGVYVRREEDSAQPMSLEEIDVQVEVSQTASQPAATSTTTPQDP